MPSFKSSRFALLVGLLALTGGPISAQGVTPAKPVMVAMAPAKPKKTFKFLKSTDLIPARILPVPPAPGSAVEARELAEVRKLVESASAERMTQARWDDEHEDPAIFDKTLGMSIKSLPKTWALLSIVQNDASLVGTTAKTHFDRTRPWGVDATLPNCDAGKGKKPKGSYPSGHSILGFSVGYVLSQLVPGKSSDIQARAMDYALSREYCGVHFSSDTEASHVVGSLAAMKLLANPKLSALIIAARSELKAAGLPTT